MFLGHLQNVLRDTGTASILAGELTDLSMPITQALSNVSLIRLIGSGCPITHLCSIMCLLKYDDDLQILL